MWPAFPIRGRTAMMVLLGLALTGCATVVKGTSNNMTVETEPAGATCRLLREDETVGAVALTPGSIVVSRDKDPLTVQCDKDGYLQANEMVEASFTGWTFGNILLGGGIGAVVDLASGANSEYPPLVQIDLIPESFPSAEERDEFFDSLTIKIRDRTAAAATRLREQCSSGQEQTCERNASEVEAAGATRLAKLAEARRLTTIRPKPADEPETEQMPLGQAPPATTPSG